MKNFYSRSKAAVFILFVAFSLPLPIFSGLVVSMHAQTVRYVKQTATGTGNGSSWANASADFQAMIDASAVNDQVWVAAGIYKPTVAFDLDGNGATARENTFYLNRNIKIYGGFVGTEIAIAQRPPFSLNTGTILSGDIGVVADSTDNAYHVMIIDATTANGNIDNTCIIDGLTFVRGIADNTTNGGLHRGGGGLQTRAAAGLLCSPKVQRTGFTNNFGRSGGAYAHFSGASNILFSDCIFDNNAALNVGGAVCVLASTLPISAFMYKNCSFTNNKTTLVATTNGTGGALYASGEIDYGGFTADSCTFVNNTANYGGGIISFINATVQNSRFTNNKAHVNGGAIVARNNSSITVLPMNLNFSNLSFTENKAAFQGGAVDLYLNKNRTIINFTNTNFTDNSLIDTLYNYGGAVQLSIEESGTYGTLNVTGCTFSNNKNKSVLTTASSFGGALYTWANNNARLTTTITNSTFSANKATRGGSITKQSNVGTKNIMYLHNSTFLRDTASRGASVYSVNDKGDDGMQISNCAFNENVSTFSGAVYKISVGGAGKDTIPSFIENCKFVANKSYVGGAVGMRTQKATDTLTIRNTLFHANKADFAGAVYAIASDSSNCSITMANNVFTKNTAVLAGGAVEMHTIGLRPTLTSMATNNTYYGNSAPLGGAVYTYKDTSAATQNVTFSNTIHNSILWQNGDGIYNNNNANTSIYNSIVDDGTPNSSITYPVGTVGSNNKDLYPAFADSTNLKGADNTWFTADDGLALTAASPAINQGNNIYAVGTQDCTLSPRIYNRTVDMGAYEYQSVVSTDNMSKQSTFIIFPNPSETGVFTLQGKTFERTDVTVTNTLGQTVAAIIQNNQLNLSQLPSGVYFVRIAGENTTIRVVKS